VPGRLILTPPEPINAAVVPSPGEKGMVGLKPNDRWRVWPLKEGRGLASTECEEGRTYKAAALRNCLLWLWASRARAVNGERSCDWGFDSVGIECDLKL
jgi:hypothetical protein